MARARCRAGDRCTRHLVRRALDVRGRGAAPAPRPQPARTHPADRTAPADRASVREPARTRAARLGSARAPVRQRDRQRGDRIGRDRLDAANPGIYLGVGATLAMHSAFVYARPMHELFHSAVLGPAERLLSAATAASVVPVVALHSGSRGGARRSEAPAEPGAAANRRCWSREDRIAAQRIARLRIICRPIAVQSDLGAIRRRKLARDGARSRVHA
jgi:hypothetical protein